MFSPALSQEEITRKLEALVATIQEMGGILEKQMVLGMKRLPLPVKKEKQGQLAVLRFILGEEKAGETALRLKGENSILRFMLMVVRQRKERMTPSFAIKQKPEKQPEEAKAEAESIDKELEEIFKEENESK